MTTNELKAEIEKVREALDAISSVFPRKRTDYSALVGELLGDESMDLDYDRVEMLRERGLSPGNNEMLRLSVKLMSRERRELRTEVRLSNQGSILFGSESS